VHRFYKANTIDEIKGDERDRAKLKLHSLGSSQAFHSAHDTVRWILESVRGKPKARTEWAIQQLKWAAKASQNLGLNAHATFSGALLWHTVYPWPQRPAGLAETGFRELATRWLPILNVFDQCGVDLCYEIHPGEDLHDGASYETFLDHVHDHPRACLLYDPSHFVLQCLDYLEYIDNYHDRIKMFHVKDAEFNPPASGVYGGYQSWINRAGRFRSLGDGQVILKAYFQNWQLMIIKDGLCWVGVASNIPMMVRRREPFHQESHHPRY
jgi:sugar phosphate isomerase/epimerase